VRQPAAQNPSAPQQQAPQQQAPPQQAPQQQAPQQQAPQQQAPPPAQPALVIPAGTAVAVRTNAPVDSSTSYPGQKFFAIVDTPVLVDGNVVVPRGANAQLEVVDATASVHKGNAGLELRLVALPVRGRFRTVSSDSFLREGSLRARTGAAVVGGAEAVGGAIGGLFHKKKGTKGEGAQAEPATRGELTIPAATRIEFHLRTAVPVS
jgi:hypothetical protein